MNDVKEQIKQVEENIISLEASRRRLLQPESFVRIRKELGNRSLKMVEERLEQYYEKLEFLNNKIE
ncbi:hypothetical protein [Vibrio sp. 1CM23M]|uniref:hypothetical protein n=1 Tax=Vibrio sp. 1CM23M TaxID=2929164 RepID=UPI0020BE04F5|nr:hypothetical protein [Vibrio sp. 1CM23M]MCK8072432.1 hypothetical protein [Vibrio sp. 1CM23M]